jgi:hypothetical protein
VLATKYALFDSHAWRRGNSVSPEAAAGQIIDLIYRQGCRRIIILKARQIGFSTLLGAVCADRLCFGLGQQISLIDPVRLLRIA